MEAGDCVRAEELRHPVDVSARELALAQVPSNLSAMRAAVTPGSFGETLSPSGWRGDSRRHPSLSHTQRAALSYSPLHNQRRFRPSPHDHHACFAPNAKRHSRSSPYRRL